jgi:hypothetical protein
MTVFGLQHRVVWWKSTDVSEVCTASVIREMAPQVKRRPSQHGDVVLKEYNTPPLSATLPSAQHTNETL